MFIMEPFLRHEEEKQAYARLHRYGQTKPVHCRCYYTPVSVEHRLLEWRRHAESYATAMNQEDLGRLSVTQKPLRMKSQENAENEVSIMFSEGGPEDAGGYRDGNVDDKDEYEKEKEHDDDEEKDLEQIEFLLHGNRRLQNQQ